MMKRERIHHHRYLTQADAPSAVFDDIERLHNPRLQHRIDVRDQAFTASTQLSAKSGKTRPSNAAANEPVHLSPVTLLMAASACEHGELKNYLELSMNLSAPFSRFCLSVVTLATAAFVTPAVAGPTNVPFKASFVTQEVLGYNADCASFTGGRTTGNGVASHLGSANFVATDCVNPGASQFVFNNGALTLTAANGDTLTASYEGVLSPNWQPNSLSPLSGVFTVTGGTGRFSRASGSGYLEGSENLATGQGHFELKGRISY